MQGYTHDYQQKIIKIFYATDEFSKKYEEDIENMPLSEFWGQGPPEACGEYVRKRDYDDSHHVPFWHFWQFQASFCKHFKIIVIGWIELVSAAYDVADDCT